MRQLVTQASLFAALALSLLATAPPAARAQLANEELICAAPEDQLDRWSLLRSVSLDLRGRMPDEAEYALLDEDPDEDLPEALVDDWLASDAFAERVVRHHKALLWNNIENLDMVSVRAYIRASAGLWWRGGTQATAYRGLPVGCRDEPATFAPDGSVVATPDVDGSKREGYVMLEPYWAPGTSIKVCAYDAQAAITSPQGVACATNAGLNELGCGCGPGLRHCLPAGISGYDADVVIGRAMADDINRRVRENILADKSYLELFTSRTMWVNGPLVHFWKYLRAYPRMNVDPAPLDVARLPDLKWTDADTWVAVDMGTEEAGILTSPAYLLRFQTNRARANRFYVSFLCQPFNAPSGGIPVADAGAQVEPDLQVRHGCEYCHALLEPAASHWGRWGERGATWLSPTTSPAFDQSCALCAQGAPCSTRCRQFYVTNALEEKSEPFIGWLNAYYFRREEHKPFVEDGPKLLVYKTVVDGRFPKCVARGAAEMLLGRPLDDKDDGWLADVADQFVASGYSYRAVVKAALEHPAYRRVR